MSALLLHLNVNSVCSSEKKELIIKKQWVWSMSNFTCRYSCTNKSNDGKSRSWRAFEIFDL